MGERATSEVPAGCVARILPEGSGIPVGAGLLIDGNRIITCAHVVAQAFRGDGYEEQPPSGAVAVDFPALGAGGHTDDPLAGHVAPGGWFPIGASGRGDIAVLDLRQDAPAGSGAPPLLRPPLMGGRAFKITGFPDLREFGVGAEGVIGDPAGPGREWIQLGQPDRTGYRIVEGFSGGPVWDMRAEAVVGIVAVVDDGDQARVGFMIPIGVLAAAWPQLEGSIGWRVHFDDVPRRAHWDPRARGVKDVGMPGDYFTGRGSALEHLVGWLDSPDKRARVVTGRPGSGKSSVLARLVMAADPIEQGRLTLPAGSTAEVTIPRERAIDLAIVATDLSLETFVETIARWCDVHIDLASDRPIETLVHGLRKRATVPVIVIDQLDGARRPDLIVHDLLRELVANEAAHLLIGLQSSEDGALLALTDPWAERVDLDGEYEDIKGLEDYIHRWLVSEDAYAADPEGVARTVARRAAERASPLFLVGLLVALWLRAQPVQGDRPAEEFPDEVPGAMKLYLHGLAAQLCREGYAEYGRSGVAAEPQPVIQRRLDALMRALAYAERPGLPAKGDVWPAISRAVGEGDFGTEDVRWLRRSAASFLIQGAEFDGTAHVRLFHGALVQAMQAAPGASPAIQAQIVEELAALYPDGSESPTDRYVELQLPAHVAKAPPGMWEWLSARTELLDRLDPAAVRSHALRTALQRSSLPPEIVGVIQSQDLLMLSGPRDRRALRQLGMARALGKCGFPAGSAVVPAAAWTVRSAVVRQHPAHLPLDVGTTVYALIAFTGPQETPIIAAGCDDGTIRLWDTATGERFGASLRGGTGAVRALAACDTEAGVRVVSAGDDRVIRIWAPLRGGEPESFDTDHEGVLRALAAFETRGALRVASAADREHEITIRDGVGGPIATLTGPGPFRSLIAVRSSAGVALHAGSEEGSVSVWEIAEALQQARGEPPLAPSAVLTGPTDWVRALCAFRLDGALHVAAAGDDLRLRIWRPPRRLPILEPETGHTAAILALATYRAGDDHIVATAGADGTVALHDAKSGQEHGRRLTGHQGPIRALTAYHVVADTARIASAGQDRTLRLWDPSSAKRIGPPGAHRVLAVAVSDGGLVVTGGDDGRVRLWNPTNGDLMHDFDARVGAIRAIVRGASATEYAFGGDAELVRFVDIETGDETAPALDGHSGPVRALASWLHAGNRMLASAGDDGTVRLWERGDAAQLGRVISRHESPLRGLAVFAGPRGPRLAVAGHGRTVELHGTTPSDVPGMALEGHQDWVMTVCAYGGPAGIELLATAGDDASVQTWSTPSGKRLAVLGRHDGPVCAIAAYGVGGQARLVTGGADCTVRVWDPEAKRELHVMRLGAKVNALAPIAGGVVAGTDEGHIAINLCGRLAAG